MDLSKRANLRGVREVRGLISPVAESPTGMTGADWGEFVDLRADGDSDPDFWIFRGEASIVDHDYTVRDMFGEFTERIAPGAFDKTLSENPDVSLNYMHDMAMTMATTRGGNLTLGANPNLLVDARVPKSDVDAQRVMPKVQRRDAGDMSFAFRVNGQVWNEDYTDRTITEVSLHRGDVAVIVSGLGANPAAWGTVRLADFSADYQPEIVEAEIGWLTADEVRALEDDDDGRAVAEWYERWLATDRARSLRLATQRALIS